jgi:hypothetical protein
LSFIVRDQEVEDSNPFAPTTYFWESTIYTTRARHETAKSAGSETKRSCLLSIGRERSLFFEFMALQREVRFTGNPILGKSSTRLTLWDEKPKSGSSSVSSPRCDLATALFAGNHQRKCLLQRFCAKAKALLRETRANPSGLHSTGVGGTRRWTSKVPRRLAPVAYAISRTGF